MYIYILDLRAINVMVWMFRFERFWYCHGLDVHKHSFKFVYHTSYTMVHKSILACTWAMDNDGDAFADNNMYNSASILCWSRAWISISFGHKFVLFLQLIYFLWIVNCFPLVIQDNQLKLLKHAAFESMINSCSIDVVGSSLNNVWPQMPHNHPRETINYHHIIWSKVMYISPNFSITPLFV